MNNPNPPLQPTHCFQCELFSINLLDKTESPTFCAHNDIPTSPHQPVCTFRQTLDIQTISNYILCIKKGLS